MFTFCYARISILSPLGVRILILKPKGEEYFLEFLGKSPLEPEHLTILSMKAVVGLFFPDSNYPLPHPGKFIWNRDAAGPHCAINRRLDFPKFYNDITFVNLT